MGTPTHSSKSLTAVLLIGVVAFIAGCCPPRRAVPETLLSQTHYAGMVDVRTDYLHYNPQIGESLTASGECSFLAISGGGAFGAGVLCGWSQTGTRPQFQVVTGVSTGALLAPFAFLGPDYDDRIKEAYTTVGNRDIFMYRGPVGIVRLFLRESYVETRPLRRMIARMFTETELAAVAAQHRAGRRLYVGTTNLDANQFVIWNMGAIAVSDHPEALDMFRKILLTSASIPGVFPPVYFDVEVEGEKYNEMHVDGGVIAGVFGYGPRLFETLREPGVTPDKPCTMYVIMNSKLDTSYEQTNPRFLRIAGRSFSSLMKRKAWSDLGEIYHQANADGVDFRYVAIPQHYQMSKKPGFDKNEMNKLFDLGFEMAAPETMWDTSVRIGP